MLGRDRAGGGGAHIGEIAVVEQQRLDKAGASAEQDHQAVEARQPELGIIEEAGADFQREAVEPRHIGGLDVDFAAMFGNVEPQDRRHHHGLGGQRPKGVLDAIDRARVERHDAAEIGFGQDQHPGHLRPPSR